MRHPVGPFAFRHTALIEHQCLLDSYQRIGVLAHDGAFLAGYFPVTGFGCAVGALAVKVLALQMTKEKQLLTVEHVTEHGGQLPRFEFAYIDLRYYIVVVFARLSQYLGLQVLNQKLLISGMESESWREGPHYFRDCVFHLDDKLVQAERGRTRQKE